MVEVSFPIMVLGVVSGVSVIFFTRTRLGAAFLSVIDLIVGITIIGSAGAAVKILSYAVPEAAILYLGIAITLKGIFYLVLSFR